MTMPSTVDPMSPELSASLADFARTCKAAARAVSLYPETHPAIQTSLSRVAAAAHRLATGSDVTLTVFPEQLAIEGRTPQRADAAIGELAALMHARLVASLRIETGATPQDWRALLLLLGRAPDELIGEGGIAKAWAASGGRHFDIRQIDYAGVLRERPGGEAANWDQIIATCLLGKTLDEEQLAVLIDTFSDPARLTDFLARLEGTEGTGGPSLSERATALLGLLHQMLGAVRDPRDTDRLLRAMAEGTARLTPEMVVALLEQARAGGDAQQTMSAVLSRMSDETVASFVAHSVVAQGGASERLAQAFQALVPESAGRERILDLARDEAAGTPIGGEGRFEDLWQSAADLLTSYSDRTYVSTEYGRQLSNARTQAIEVERVSDDPPERLLAWTSTVSDAALRQLDLDLILDLLRIETDPDAWHPVAEIAIAEAGRRAAAGDAQGADACLDTLARIRADGEDPRSPLADQTLRGAASGPLVPHLLAQLREASEGAELTSLSDLCTALGPGIVRPLAEALAREENPRLLKRLRDLLLVFGAEGAFVSEQLRRSPHAAVRRVAVELMRIAESGALVADLATLLSDPDSQVQRESLRTLVEMGTPEARAPVAEALGKGGSEADALLQHLIDLKDDRAAPMLGAALAHVAKGRLHPAHTGIIDALGALAGHPESIRALKAVLYRGEWWAPRRTAELRRAAAAALRRINSADADAVLEEAAANGSRGVRKAARAQLATRSGAPAP